MKFRGVIHADQESCHATLEQLTGAMIDSATLKGLDPVDYPTKKYTKLYIKKGKELQQEAKNRMAVTR